MFRWFGAGEGEIKSIGECSVSNRSRSSICGFIFITLLIWWGGANAFAAGRQQLNGHLLKIIQTAPLVGRLEGSRQLHLAIGLPLRNKEALQKYLKELYDPQSPNYRKFLTPEKFAQ